MSASEILFRNEIMNPPADIFATTHWTLVRAAGDGALPAADEALETLCEAYWFPLYAYVRRHGFSKEDAEDLTQAFFAKLLERRDIAGLKQENGRFRAFLLASLKHFLANERDRAGRLKRGGNITHLSLDWQSADARFQLADGMQVPPDAAFDREWALALLARVVGMLQGEYAAEGKAERLEQLKPWLTAASGTIQYASAAEALAMDENSVRVAVHRLRRRYRELLRAEIAHTLGDPAMVEQEMAALLEAFRR
jgi:RNA polymerase sigma-70 factor (ECF subfamily)